MDRAELSKPFEIVNFKKLISGLVEATFFDEAREIRFESSVISNALNIGNFLGNKFYNIIVIEHSAGISARVSLARDSFKLMAENNIDKALIAYIPKSNNDEWRFSFVSITLEENQGKIKRTFSNPRRFSYLLGAGTKTLTPFRYLIQKGRVNSVEDLLERFSIEVVNNEFYREIARLYDELVGADKVVRKMKHPSEGEESHEFAVRLIGRIIFCWFLREKKSINGIPLIPDNILSKEAAKTQNYYHAILAPLFFEVLNRPPNRRSNKFQSNGYELIPYLNGGLFSDDNIDSYKFDKMLELSVPGEVDVPNDWLNEFIDLLERFNFTVDENTSFDTDLSIDPEMLGRVFENLLARINPETGETVRRSTGSFYTPREIVEYMVDTSLSEYLLTKTGISKTKIEALVSYDLLDDEENSLDTNEANQVLEALSVLTVLDPACGSGAFPIGMLQKIVYIISILDSEAKWWLSKQLEGASLELRKEFEKKSVDYIRKLGIIRQTIFGVDIQPIATEISRLRCFLTLIVDEAIDDTQENRGIRALPNLEFKFVTANSLLPLPEQRFSGGQVQQDIFDTKQQEKIERLRILINEFFTANSIEKSEVKAEYRYVQNQLWNDMHKSSSYGQQSLALTGWDPFEHTRSEWFDPNWMFGIKDGFDIIIGNPPYIQLQKNGGELANLYSNQGYATFARTGDIYTLFYERGINLLKETSGVLCYITSNKWLRASYGKKTKEYFNSKNPVTLIDFGGYKIFDTATVDTCIMIIQNCANLYNLKAARFDSNFTRGQSIKKYFYSHHHLISKPNEKWIIDDRDNMDLKLKIEKNGTPLNQWSVKINFGVKTGCNEAFIIDEATRHRLITEDPKSAEIIKPILRGRDIKRYNIDFQNLYILATGFDKNIPIEYPAVYRHIKKVGDDIESKNIKVKGKGVFGRDDKGVNWWNLRACDYYRAFEEEKIVWKRIGSVIRFGYDTSGAIGLDSTCVMTGKNLKLILAVLNSRLGHYILQDSPRTGTGDLILSVQAINPVPIPIVNESNKELVDKIESLVMLLIEHDNIELESEIDKQVYKLYDLSNEEIKIIEKV